MKQTFALDLSQTGIRLTVTEGKQTSVLGEVSVDDPHFETRVEDLRQEAADLAKGPLETKLVIPASEILFTSVDVKPGEKRPHDVLVKEALEGMTPYNLDDLVLDWAAKSDKQILVAAVAKETLAEAEGFAVSNGFNPRNFVALPRKGAFKGAPSFGKTRHAIDGASAPVVAAPDVTRVADLEIAELDETPSADATSVDGTPAAAEAAVKPETSAPKDNEVPADPPNVTQTDLPAFAPKDGPSAVPAAKIEDVADALRSGAKPVETGGKPAPASVEITTAKTPPILDDLPSQPPSAATFASRRVGQPEPPATSPESETRLGQIASRIAMLPDGGAGPLPATAAKGGADAPRGPKGPPQGVGPQRTPTRRATPTVSDAAPAAATLAPRPAAAPAPAQTAPHKPANEAEAMTVFGARRSPSAKRSGGLTSIAVGLVVALVLVAGIWSAYSLMEESDSAGEPSAEQSGALAVPSDAAPRDIASTADAPDPAPLVVEDPVAESVAPEAQPVAPVTAAPEAETELAALPETVAPENAPDTAELPSDIAPEPTEDGEIAADVPEIAPDVSTSMTERLVLSDDTAGEAPRAASPFDSPATLGLAPAVPEPEGPRTPRVDTAAALPLPDPLRRPAGADEAGRYAATGIWENAPDAPGLPPSDRIDTLYTAALDPQLRLSGAVAAPDLPAPDGSFQNASLPPPPAGTTFDLDDNGLVRATPQGAISPEGILIYAGAPSARPPQTPARPTADTDDTTIVPRVRVNPGEPDIRPRQRPQSSPANDTAETQGGDDANLSPSLEPAISTRRATLSPIIRPERAPRPAVEVAPTAIVQTAGIDTPKPRARPQSEAEQWRVRAEQAAAAAASASAAMARNAGVAVIAPTTPAPQTDDVAVASSLTPRARPVAPTPSAPQLATPAPQPQRQVAPAPTEVASATATIAPRIPSSASVTKRATEANVLKLNRINLIGVSGSATNRRALVRLPSGRFVKLKVGDRVDGGRVRAISDSQLQYVKSGRTLTLSMPTG